MTQVDRKRLKVEQAMSIEPLQEKKIAFYSIAQLAERWGVSDSTIRREIKRGRLKQKHIGGQVRFAAEDVALYERMAR